MEGSTIDDDSAWTEVVTTTAKVGLSPPTTDPLTTAMRWGLGVVATRVCDGGGRRRLQDEEGGGGEAPAAQAEQGMEEEGEGSGPPGERQQEEEEETGGHDDVEGEEEGEEEPLLPTEEEMEALAASLEGQFFCEYGPSAGIVQTELAARWKAFD